MQLIKEIGNNPSSQMWDVAESETKVVSNDLDTEARWIKDKL